jgi:hypothetical protein
MPTGTMTFHLTGIDDAATRHTQTRRAVPARSRTVLGQITSIHNGGHRDLGVGERWWPISHGRPMPEP